MVIESKYAYAIDSWLEEATKGLCDSARERIREETEAHYLDAYAEGLSQGMGEEEAHYTALRGLGTAQAAKKWFRKVHLTSDEIYELGMESWFKYRSPESWHKYNRIYLVFCLCYLAVVLVVWIGSNFSLHNFSGVLMGMIFLQISIFEHVRYRLFRNLPLIKFLWYGVMFYPVLVVCVVIIAIATIIVRGLQEIGNLELFDIVFYISGSFTCVFLSIRYRRIFDKFRRVYKGDDLRFRM